MGQRSQIYIRYNEKLIIANYYQWNYGELMISRARGAIEWIKDRIDLGYYWIFKDKSYIKKLSRICDVNFDMRDIALSCDIVQEWGDQFSEQPFNECVFYQQDNNDGQLFIDISADGVIKYAFSKNPDYTKLMNCNDYMAWDFGADWHKYLSDVDSEALEICKRNIGYIQANATLMTYEELYAFINANYNPENADYKNFMQ
jgi:hypothetical protein